MVNSIIKALSNSKVKFSKIIRLLSKNSISNQEIDNIEEMLIEADLGYDLSEEIIGIIKKQSDSNSDLIKNMRVEEDLITIQ